MKQFIAILVLVLAATSIIFGSIKPLKKAQAYVNAVKSNPSSVQGFINGFDKAFMYPSPVGEDELIRFVSNDVMNIIMEGKNDKVVVDALVDFIHARADKKIESGVGMNYAQTIMIIGTIHAYKWEKFNDPKDFDLAMKYFSRGYTISPQRPQFLIGLLNLYEASGQKEKAELIKNQIDLLWGKQ